MHCEAEARLPVPGFFFWEHREQRLKVSDSPSLPSAGVGRSGPLLAKSALDCGSPGRHRCRGFLRVKLQPAGSWAL
jgi:hypothetical protein